jgi:AcrR family transcriptional regulator
LEAFDYAAQRMGDRFTAALEQHSDAVEKLRSIVEVYTRMPSDPPVPGGCPLLNAAVEADDADPALKARVRGAMRNWVRFVQGIVVDGQRCGRLTERVDADNLATTLIASLEGAIMMSKLLGDDAPMHQVSARLNQLIDELALG